MNEIDQAVMDRTGELVQEFEDCLKKLSKEPHELPQGYEFRTFQCWVCEKLAFLELLITTHDVLSKET